MTSDRRKLGYIWGGKQLLFVNENHYAKAFNSSDLLIEEYYYQSVFHGPHYAKVLTYEIFQKKFRNKVSNIVDLESIISASDTDVINYVRSKEIKKSVKYTRVSDDFKLISTNVESCRSILFLLRLVIDLLNDCNPDQMKVLAFLIFSTKNDNIVIEASLRYKSLEEISRIILEIWSKDIIDINKLNNFIGTKYRADKARKDLADLVRKRFPFLSNTILSK